MEITWVMIHNISVSNNNFEGDYPTTKKVNSFLADYLRDL